MSILTVEGLEVSFGEAKVLRGVNLQLEAGKTLGVVGESGCGKSMTAFSIMGMVPGTGRITAGSIQLEGRELTTLSQKEWREVRGAQISLVMQDPFTSLNPMMRVGDQIAESIVLHLGKSWAEARKMAIQMLDEVGVPSPETSARKYPHQMSGGQRQRVVIAIAFATRPKVLIADEPTTALDVTLQAQILRLIQTLQNEEGTAVMLVSHDIGVIGAISSQIAVFYAGKVVEQGTAEQVLRTPAHPYTQGLLNSLPRKGSAELQTIKGYPPNLSKPIEGCSFMPRCPHAFEKCQTEPAILEVAKHHCAACWKASSLAGAAALPLEQ